MDRPRLPSLETQRLRPSASSRSTKRRSTPTLTPLSSEKDPPHFRALDEGGSWPLDREASALQNIAAARHRERELDVLFDEQDRHAFRLEHLEHRLHLLHDLRREPEKRLIDHE